MGGFIFGLLSTALVNPEAVDAQNEIGEYPYSQEVSRNVPGMLKQLSFWWSVILVCALVLIQNPPQQRKPSEEIIKDEEKQQQNVNSEGVYAQEF